MPTLKAPMALTAELVARVERLEPDPGLGPGIVHLTEADYDGLVRGLLELYTPRELWVFGYGSLIWKPEFTSVEHRRATAFGWHRSFCMTLTRFRGTREQPGLMMALDRGGCCHGVVYRLPDENHADQLGRLVRREISIRRSTNTARWLTVDTDLGKLRACVYRQSRGDHLRRQTAGRTRRPNSGRRRRPLGFGCQLSVSDDHQTRGIRHP